MLNPYEGGQFKVTSIYGMRVLNGKKSMHNGLDLVGVSSRYLIAIGDGVIESSTIVTNKKNITWQWGNYVKLRLDDGTIVFYCHLEQRLVAKGQTVKAGDRIGIEGHTGYSFGNHCHLEIRNRDNKATAECNTATYTGIPNVTGTYNAKIVTVNEPVPETNESEDVLNMTKDELSALIDEKINAAINGVNTNINATIKGVIDNVKNTINNPATEPSDWAKVYWERAKSEGITDGSEPQSMITRQEAATMILGATRKTGGASDWAKDIWAKATELGITDGTNPQHMLTRQEVAAMIMKAMVL